MVVRQRLSTLMDVCLENLLDAGVFRDLMRKLMEIVRATHRTSFKDIIPI